MPLKDPIVCIQVDRSHVDAVFVGDDVGDLVRHALSVKAAHINMSQVGEHLELVPGCLDNIFPMTGHQFDCLRTCFAVDDDLFIFRNKTHHIVARYGIAAGCRPEHHNHHQVA